MDLASGETHGTDESAKVGSALHRSLATTRPSVLGRSNFFDPSLTGSTKADKGLVIGDASTVLFLESLANDPDRPLDDWSMFYCGASSDIEQTLRSIGKRYHIALGVERFDW